MGEGGDKGSVVLGNEAGSGRLYSWSFLEGSCRGALVGDRVIVVYGVSL